MLFICVCSALLVMRGVACRARRCSALLVSLRCYLALLGFVDVACLAWHGSALLGTVWHCFVLFGVASPAWPRRLPVLVALRSSTVWCFKWYTDMWKIIVP